MLYRQTGNDQKLRVAGRAPTEREVDMVGIVLTGHGEFSLGLKSALEMIAGPQSDFEAVTFKEEEAGDYAAKLREAITAMRADHDGVLVLCDLMGGTPFNQSMLISADTEGVAVVAGANLPMLIDISMARTDDSKLDDLVSEAVEVGREGVVHKVLEADAGADEDDEM